MDEGIKQLNTRLPMELYRWLLKTKEKTGTAINQQIINLVEQKKENEKKIKK